MASGCMTLVKSVCEAYFFYRNILSWWLSSDILTNNSKVVVPNRQGHQIAQKRQGLPGAGKKKGKNKNKKQKWGGDKPPDAQIAHNPVFRSFTKIHRNIPVSAGSFIAIREGDPPRLPHVHKFPQAKSFITARKLPTMSTL